MQCRLFHSRINDSSINSLSRQTNGKTLKCEHCGKLFHNMRGLKIHISKAHYEVHRRQIAEKYVSKGFKNNDSVSDDCGSREQDISPQMKEKTCAVMDHRITSQVEEWIRTSSVEMSNQVFSANVTQILKFLAEVVHDLPGPKHPARI